MSQRHQMTFVSVIGLRRPVNTKTINCPDYGRDVVAIQQVSDQRQQGLCLQPTNSRPLFKWWSFFIELGVKP